MKTELKQDIQGKSYKVKIKKLGAPDVMMDPFEQKTVVGAFGTNTLTVNEKEFVLTHKAPPNTHFSVNLRWGQVRELVNELETKKSFRANFGGDQNKDILLSVKIIEGDLPYLIDIMSKVPDAAYGKRCPACGGVALNGVCNRCGGHAGNVQRENGLKMMAIGLGIIVLGGVVALFFPYGIVVAAYGAYRLIKGLFKLIFGTR